MDETQISGGRSHLKHPDSTGLVAWLKPHRRMVAAVCALCLALALATLRVTTFSTGLGVRLSAPWAFMDFRRAVYDPLVRFLAGANPYDFLSGSYLPSILLLHLPIGLLPVGTATAVYISTILVLTIGIAYVAFAFNGLPIRAPDLVLVIALLLLSRPGQWNLLLGQLAAQMALATYVALYYARSHPVLSAAGLTIAMIKPTFGLPLAALMLARRDVRAVLLGIVLTAIVNLPLLVIAADRAGGVGPLLSEVIIQQRAFEMRDWNDPLKSIARVDATAMLSHLLGIPLRGLAQVPVAVAVLLPAGFALRRLTVGVGEPARFIVSSGITCTTMLLCVYHQAYDVVLLTVPAVALAYSPVSRILWRSHVRRCMAALIAFLALNYASTEAVLAKLNLPRTLWLLVTSLNGLCLLALFAGYCLTGLSRTAEPGRWRTPADELS